MDKKRLGRACHLATLAFIASLGVSSCKQDNGEKPAYEMVRLNRFPVSLDFLFRTSDPTSRNQILNGIRNGRPEASMLFLVPYPNYHHHDHFPATLKWYLYTGGHTPISLPLPSFLEVRDDTGKPTVPINGVTCINDVTATLHLSYYIRVMLGHMCITQSLADQYHAAGTIDVFGQQLQAVPLAADAVIGYTHSAYALDFIVKDDSNSNFDPQGAFTDKQNCVNPYFYLSDAAQSQLRSYYQDQLDAMKQSGLYPESRLDRTYDINEAQSIYGTWFYKQGYLSLGSGNHPYGWYSFDGCILNILSLNKTDRDTFWKNSNTGLAIAADVLGVFCDAFYPGSVPDYEVIGGRYMVRCEGDGRNGIVRLDNFFANARPSPLYLKYQLVEGSASTIWDDQLNVDYFSSLTAAQGPFSPKKLTYVRMYERAD
jgi:hypothetical protein